MPRCRIYIVLLFTIVLGSAAWSQTERNAFEVALPSGGGTLSQPSCVYFDSRSHEVYVADAGNNRIAIFDRNGNFDFAFTDRDHLWSPSQIEVDSLGHIYVLSESQRGYLNVFDYDGTFLTDLTFRDKGGDTLSIVSFVIDEADRLFLVTNRPSHVYVYRSNATPLNDFPILDELDSLTRKESLSGSTAIVNGELVIPLPIAAQLVRYSLDGKYLGLVGHPGGAAGELAFPVASASDGKGGMLVLDKTRHTVLRYDAKGEFASEFGGLGQSLGWFYYPSSMTTNNQGICYVAQSFRNRVQGIAYAPETDAALNRFATDAKPEKISAAESPSTPK